MTSGGENETLFWVDEPDNKITKALTKSSILKPQETLLKPDYYIFIVTPSSPGTFDETIGTPPIARISSDESRLELAKGVLTNTQKRIDDIERTGANWRWITLDSSTQQPPEIQELFTTYGVNISAGEGLRFLAYSGAK